jgi:hypothetical protein
MRILLAVLPGLLLRCIGSLLGSLLLLLLLLHIEVIDGLLCRVAFSTLRQVNVLERKVWRRHLADLHAAHCVKHCVWMRTERNQMIPLSCCEVEAANFLSGSG